MSDRFLHRIAGLVFNTPLAIDEQAGRVVLAALGERVGLNFLNADAVAPAELQASSFYGQRCEGGYVRTQGGTAIVPIVGELVNRGSYLGAPSGLTSYEGLQQQARLLAEDPNVKTIVLDMKSPGGEFSGMIETAAAFKKLDAKKPVYAVVNDLAASAAYCIASAARKIIVSPFGRVGSIGVITFHADMSKALAKSGVTVTIMQAGAHKSDGSPMLPLADDVKAEIMGVIGSAYDKFVKAVAANRPKLNEKAARATEARVLWDTDAVEAGLADAVGTLDSLLAGLGDSPKATSAPRDSLFGQDDGVTKVTAITAGLSARSYVRDDQGEFAEDGKPNEDGSDEGGVGKRRGEDDGDDPQPPVDQRRRQDAIDKAKNPPKDDGADYEDEPPNDGADEPYADDPPPEKQAGDDPEGHGYKYVEDGVYEKDGRYYEHDADGWLLPTDESFSESNDVATRKNKDKVDKSRADAAKKDREDDGRRSRQSGMQKKGAPRKPSTQGPKGASMSEKDIRAAERERIAAIIGSEEAKGREQLAAHLANKTGMSAASAIATLAASNKAAAPLPITGAGVAGAELSGTVSAQPVINAAEIYADRNKAFRA